MASPAPSSGSAQSPATPYHAGAPGGRRQPAVVDAVRPGAPVLPAVEPAGSTEPPSEPTAVPAEAVRPDRPVPDAPRGSQGTLYHARRRPGLTTPGVAVLSTAVGLVFGLISVVLTGGLGWLFGVPLALISGYCAWEVRESDRRAPLLAPPLTLLVVALLTSLVSDGWLGVTGMAVKVLTTLIAAAPMLVVAEAVVVAVLLVRHLRRRRGATGT